MKAHCCDAPTWPLPARGDGAPSLPAAGTVLAATHHGARGPVIQWRAPGGSFVRLCAGETIYSVRNRNGPVVYCICYNCAHGYYSQAPTIDECRHGVAADAWQTGVGGVGGVGRTEPREDGS